jgi:hypothetical protein
MQVKPPCSWKPKATSGEKLGEAYKTAHGIPGEQSVSKYDNCKCSACDELVIITSGSILDCATDWMQDFNHHKTWQRITTNDNVAEQQGGLESLELQFVPQMTTISPSFLVDASFLIRSGWAKQRSCMFCLRVEFIAQQQGPILLPFIQHQRSFPCTTRMLSTTKSALLSGKLVMNKYEQTMNKVLLLLIGKHPLICFTLDGAPNLQRKQGISNMMMACTPKAEVLDACRVHRTMSSCKGGEVVRRANPSSIIHASHCSRILFLNGLMTPTSTR